jgi:cbb3-type cytochrome oxidase maturation protein
MDIIYFLIGTSVVIALLFFTAFIWSIRSGQYEDTYTPSVRMLFDPAPSQAPPASTHASPAPETSQDQA